MSKDRLTEAWAHPRGVAGHLAGLEMSVGKRPAVDLALDLMDLAGAARVVEVGCGPGVATKALAARAPHGSVTGIDPSPVMLAQARLRNRAAIAAGRVRLLTGRAETLPVDASAEFTHYLSMYSAGFWESIHDGLREAHRVLVPSGRLVILVRPAKAPAPMSLAERIADLARSVGFDGAAADRRRLGRRGVDVVQARSRSA
jgi:ubiquinone/menaquinone biosynthesis C-methylase UbiE